MDTSVGVVISLDMDVLSTVVEGFVNIVVFVDRTVVASLGVDVDAVVVVEVDFFVSMVVLDMNVET